MNIQRLGSFFFFCNYLLTYSELQYMSKKQFRDQTKMLIITGKKKRNFKFYQGKQNRFENKLIIALS